MTIKTDMTTAPKDRDILVQDANDNAWVQVYWNVIDWYGDGDLSASCWEPRIECDLHNVLIEAKAWCELPEEVEP